MDLPPFEELATLSIRITEDCWSQFWRSLPRVAPNLVKLDVDLFVSMAPHTIPKTGSMVLPASVHTLCLTTTPETFDNVVALVNLEPTSKRVHLRGRQLDRCPLNQHAINTLHLCKSKQLELSFDKQASNKIWHNMLRQPGAFRHVENLIVGFPDVWVSALTGELDDLADFPLESMGSTSAEPANTCLYPHGMARNRWVRLHHFHY